MLESAALKRIASSSLQSPFIQDNLAECERNLQINQSDKNAISKFVEVLTPIRDDIISKHE